MPSLLSNEAENTTKSVLITVPSKTFAMHISDRELFWQMLKQTLLVLCRKYIGTYR